MTPATGEPNPGDSLGGLILSRGLAIPKNLSAQDKLAEELKRASASGY